MIYKYLPNRFYICLLPILLSIVITGCDSNEKVVYVAVPATNSSQNSENNSSNLAQSMGASFTQSEQQDVSSDAQSAAHQPAEGQGKEKDSSNSSTVTVSFRQIDFYDEVVANSENEYNVIERGLPIRFRLEAHNGYDYNLLGGKAVLTTKNSDVNIIDGQGNFNNLNAGSSGWSADEFEIEIDTDAPSGTVLTFTMTFVDDNVSSVNDLSTFSFPIDRLLSKGDVSVADDNNPDSQGDGDGIIEVGEVIEIIPKLSNKSEYTLDDVSAQLIASGDYLEVWDYNDGVTATVYDTYEYGDISKETHDVTPEADFVFQVSELTGEETSGMKKSNLFLIAAAYVNDFNVELRWKLDLGIEFGKNSESKESASSTESVIEKPSSQSTVSSSSSNNDEPLSYNSMIELNQPLMPEFTTYFWDSDDLEIHSVPLLDDPDLGDLEVSINNNELHITFNSWFEEYNDFFIDWRRSGSPKTSYKMDQIPSEIEFEVKGECNDAPQATIIIIEDATIKYGAIWPTSGSFSVNQSVWKSVSIDIDPDTYTGPWGYEQLTSSEIGPSGRSFDTPLSMGITDCTEIYIRNVMFR